MSSWASAWILRHSVSFWVLSDLDQVFIYFFHLHQAHHQNVLPYSSKTQCFSWLHMFADNGFLCLCNFFFFSSSPGSYVILSESLLWSPLSMEIGHLLYDIQKCHYQFWQARDMVHLRKCLSHERVSRNKNSKIYWLKNCYLLIAML